MKPYVSGQANLRPPKRIQQLRKLLDTKSPDICIVRGEGLGDVLMTTPTIEALKNILPEQSKITYATNTRYLSGGLVKALQYNPSVDQVIDRDQLDEGDYDLVVNLHCPCVAYEKKSNPPLNRIDIFANHTGVKLENKLPRYYIQPSEVEWGKSFLAQHRIGLTDKKIMVHVFTTAVRRNLDSSLFKSALMDLASKGYKLFILSHSTDYPGSVQFDNIPGAIVLKDEDIRNVAGLMVNCNLVLCPDSAILHLAGALSVPTVSIFGHTDPRARINYYKETVAIWPGQRLQCACCWSGPCNMKDACYKMVTKEMIVDACVDRLGSTDQKVSIYEPQTIRIERI